MALVAPEVHRPCPSEIRACETIRKAAEIVQRALEKFPPDIETIACVLCHSRPFVIREIAKIQILALSGMFDHGDAVALAGKVFDRMYKMDKIAAACWYNTYFDYGYRLVRVGDAGSEWADEGVLKEMYKKAKQALISSTRIERRLMALAWDAQIEGDIEEAASRGCD